MIIDIDTFVDKNLPILLTFKCGPQYTQNKIEPFGDLYKINHTSESIDKVYCPIYDINNKQDVETLRKIRKEEGTDIAYSCQYCSCTSNNHQYFKGTPTKGCDQITYKVLCDKNPISMYGLAILPINHVPQNCFYYDKRIFTDICYILKQSETICAYINDIVYPNSYVPDHLNITLSLYHNPYLDFLPNMTTNGKYYRSDMKSAKTGINWIAYVSDNFTEVYDNVKNDIISIPNDVKMSSCMFYNKGKYFLFVTLVNLENIKSMKVGSFQDKYIVAYCPASHICVMKNMNTHAFKTLNKSILKVINTDISFYFRKIVVWNSMLYKYNSIVMKTIQSIIKMIDDSVYSLSASILYIALSYLKYNKQLSKQIYTNIFRYCTELKNNIKDTNAFVYLVSLSTNSEYISYDDIISNSTIDARIAMSMIILLQTGLSNKHFYLDSSDSVSLLYKTISGLILTTSDLNFPVLGESINVNKWLKYNYEPITKDNTMLTQSSVKSNIDNISINNIDFIVKMIPVESKTDIKYMQYIRELYTSMIVNKLRTEYNIPNFMMCYGGYNCNVRSRNGMCDVLSTKINDRTINMSYLLLEKIKGISFREYIMNEKNKEIDIIIAMCQILSSIAFAWNKMGFTHYDLHVQNIMVVDIIDDVKYVLEKNGNSSSLIEKSTILFNYFVDPFTNIMSIPVKNLFVIIDFGYSYVNGMPEGTSLPDNNMYINSTVSNRVIDVYYFILDLLNCILNYRKDIFIVNDEINNDSLLLKFIRHFIIGYRELWIQPPDITFEKFLNFILATQKQSTKFINYCNSYFYELIKPEYQSGIVLYFSENFKETMVGEDFSDPLKVCKLLNAMFINPLLEKPSTSNSIVFNFGDIGDTINRLHVT